MSRFIRVPVIDLDTCVGTGECVRNCGQKALRLVNGRAVLVNRELCANCKESACEYSCPTGAITLKYKEV